MLAYFWVPLTWREVLRRTVQESLHDNCLGMAAQLLAAMRAWRERSQEPPRPARWPSKKPA